jgi:curli biogenesis system outer membrane secretion channel CsgG
MKPRTSNLRWPAFGAIALLAGCASLPGDEAPAVNPQAVAATTPAPAARKLTHRQGEPVAVAVYQFPSNIAEIPERGTTDMFITALAQTGQFHVVDRSQSSQSVIQEKQLNSQGLSAGDSAQQKLRGAQYIFEGAITEANGGETQRSSAIGVAGMSVSGGNNRDTVGVDVRILDAATGDVVDVVSVRKTVKSDSAGVSGIGNLLGTMLAARGKSTTYTPDVNVLQQRKQGVDAALRAVINQAVAQLSARF